MRSILVPVAALFLLSGCDLLQPKVSQAKLEEALKNWLLQHDLPAEDIHCPDNQLMEKGNVFECTCKVHGTSIPVKVEVTDPTSGTVEWKPVYTIHKGKLFADEMRTRDAFKGHDIDVSCPDKVMLSIPDSTWECDLTDKGDNNKKYTVKVTFTDGEGTHNFKAEPK